MNKEELLKEIMELPKAKTINPISAMNSINVDDLMNAVDRLNKVPDYNDLLKENQELKKQLEVSNELVTQNTLTKMKLCDEVNRLRKEYQDTYKDVRIEIKEYKNQQQEFIKYLEDEIQKKSEKSITLTSFIRNVVPLQQCLQKYKSIIGE